MKKIPLLWLVEHSQAERAAARLRAKEIQHELLQKEQVTPDGKKMLYSIFVDENVFNEAQAAVNAKTKFEYKPPESYGMNPLSSIVASEQKRNRYFIIILICLVVFFLAGLVYMLVLFT